MKSSAEIQVFLESFGQRVKTLREEHNLTQMDLAAKTDIDIRQIQRIEAGDINTSIGNAHLLAQGFGVSLSSLMELEEE